MSRRQDEGDDLRLTDRAQLDAVAGAAYRSMLVSGCGRVRSAAFADHFALHFKGNLRQRGYVLTLTWVSVDARDTLTRARSVGVEPRSPAPDPEEVGAGGLDHR